MKSWKLSAAALITLLLLPGCLHYEQETTLDASGSGSMRIHYWSSEQTLSWMENGDLSFDEERARTQYEGNGVQVTNVAVETQASDSTRHVRVDLDFDSIEKLGSAKGFSGSSFAWKGDGDTRAFTHTITPRGGTGDVSLDAFTVRYIYHFPGEIVECNADSTDGSTAVWTFPLSDLSKPQKLTATIAVSASNGVTWVLGVIGVVVLLIIVIAVLRRKK